MSVVLKKHASHEKITDYLKPKPKRVKIYNSHPEQVRYITLPRNNKILADAILTMLPVVANKLWDQLPGSEKNYRKELAHKQSGLSLRFGFNIFHKPGALTKFPKSKQIIALADMLLGFISHDKDYSAFSINKNRKFQKHFDDKNTKPSIIVSFGTHTSGGGLIIYDGIGGSTTYDINRKFLLFDGKRLDWRFGE